jgi:hypothetical protein
MDLAILRKIFLVFYHPPFRGMIVDDDDFSYLVLGDIAPD